MIHTVQKHYLQNLIQAQRDYFGAHTTTANQEHPLRMGLRKKLNNNDNDEVLAKFARAFLFVSIELKSKN